LGVCSRVISKNKGNNKRDVVPFVTALNSIASNTPEENNKWRDDPYFSAAFMNQSVLRSNIHSFSPNEIYPFSHQSQHVASLTVRTRAHYRRYRNQGWPLPRYQTGAWIKGLLRRVSQRSASLGRTRSQLQWGSEGGFIEIGGNNRCT
jgi:hypothetical protein